MKRLPSKYRRTLTFGDLFCGAGLGASGAAAAGATSIFAVDSWDLAVKTYSYNFPNAHTFCEDVNMLSPTRLARQFSPDVLLTSPECTSHSIARGSNPGSEKSRETAWDVVRWIEAMKPRWVIVENVRRMKKWARHGDIIAAIESNGYTVNDLYLNAADFGVPQSRKRMFLVCSRDGALVTEEKVRRSIRRTRKDARIAIDWTTRYPSAPLYAKRRADATIERAERAIDVIGSGVPFIVVYYGSDYAGGWQSVDVPLRTVTTLDRFGLVTWSGKTPLLRMLQPRELLRAMGVRRNLRLEFGNRREKVKLCGNGVCPPVVEAIFKQILSIEE